MLDHIWTNLDNVELSGVISDVNVTDHFPCFILFSFTSNENENMVKAFRDLSQDNINSFSDVLQEFTNKFSVNENDNVNIKVNLNMVGLHTLYNECFPLRWKRMSRNRLLKSWVTNINL